MVHAKHQHLVIKLTIFIVYTFKLGRLFILNVITLFIAAGFCVERHDVIKTFQPEPFWVIQVAVQATEYRKLVLEWERVRLFDREVASTFHQKIKDVKQAK